MQRSLRCDQDRFQARAARASRVWFCCASPRSSLQADDLPAALHGLLKQAAQLLKPPSRFAAPAAPPAARQALVAGLLLTLERLVLVAAQQRSPKLVKVRGNLLGWLVGLAWGRGIAGLVGCGHRRTQQPF